MKLSEITEPGEYWAISTQHKHYPCTVDITPMGAMVHGLEGRKLKIASYKKRGQIPQKVEYQPRRKILSI